MTENERARAITRAEVKGVILVSLEAIFKKGFKKWHEGRKQDGSTSLFADAFEAGKTISLKKGTLDIRRRFYYFCEVYKAFFRFLADLERAEEWLNENDFEEVENKRSLAFREEVQEKYEKTYGNPEAGKEVA